MSATESSSSPPRVSVIIRSYKRLGALRVLLRRLLDQRHDSFEIVVVEQTPEPDPQDWAAIEELASDARIRLIQREPLGGPAARNLGVECARGDLLIFIDDDDLPCGDDWIEAHERHYDHDDKLVGVSARYVLQEGEECPYSPVERFFARHFLCLRYTPLKNPTEMGRFDEDIHTVDWLFGTNASLKRSVAMRAGLWDTNTRNNDEHSFAFKLERVREPGEHLGFRAEPTMIRGIDVPGGMDKRFNPAPYYVQGQFGFYNNIVAKYYPRRFRWFYPLYLAMISFRTMGHVWTHPRPDRTVGDKFVDSLSGFGEIYRQASTARRKS